MAFNNNNNIYKSNQHPLNPTLYCTLLKDFEVIQYQGLMIPRIIFGSNNINNFNDLLYLPLKDINYKNLDKSKEKSNRFVGNGNEDIFPINKNNDKQNLIFNDKKNESNIYDDKLLLYEKKDYFDKNINSNYHKKEKIQLNNINEVKIKCDPIPPTSIISIFSDETKNILDLNQNNKSSNEYINNIILNNINIILNKNTLLFSKVNIFPKNIEIDVTNNIIIPIPDKDSKKKNISNPSSTSDFSEKYVNKPLFSVSKYSFNDKLKRHLKRGRKGSNNNKRIHGASDDDNVMRKIQVHFLSFVINFVNDVIKTFVNNKNVPLFKNLDYKIKKTVNRKSVENLKSKKLAEILQLKVSPKMKIHDESVNKIIYNKICDICPFMADFLQISYLSLFKDYYYNKSKIFEINGKVIQLSKKTQTFHDLMEKNNSHKDKLKYITINYFLNSSKRYKKAIIKKLFETSQETDIT